MRLFGFILILALISGCVSRVKIEELENKNQANYYEANLSIANLLNRGLNVANGYLSLADQVATTQDGVAVFNILLASGAAIAVLNDVSTTTLAGVGVGGLAVNQATSYFDPVTARDSLTRAAKRNYCIVGVGQAYGQNNPSDRRVFADALTRVKFLLREDLNREPNNYADLFAAQTAAQLQGQRAFNLQTEVNKCLAVT